MKVFRMLIVLIPICVILFGGIAIRSVLLDKQIASLEGTCEVKQSVIDKLMAQAFHTDEQSVSDKKYMETAFSRIFTFYNMDEFDAARDRAIGYGLPKDFVNCFYDKSEMSSIYAESMLDVMCKFKSADFYLLDRDETTAYYYADVKLDTVKYSDSVIELGFFIALRNEGIDTERFASVVYYDIV